MKRLLPFLGCSVLLLVFACTDRANISQTEPSTHKKEGNGIPADTLTYRLVYDEELGWGYQIFHGTKMLIEQKHIPAIQGMKGFESRDKAEITATYLIERIRKGESRPTISMEQLDSLGVLPDQKDTR